MLRDENLGLLEELELSPAERMLCQAYRSGTAFDGGYGGRTSTAVVGEEQQGQEVRGLVISSLLVAPPPALPGKAAALRMVGVRVSGDVNLSNASIAVPVEFRDCRFDQPMSLVDCAARALILDGCQLPLVDGRRLTVQQAQAVHDLPFAARHILPAVPADTVGADGVGRPQRLRVDDRRRPRAAAGVHCWQITF
ncbi:hypothetical protein [Streptomyces sp. NPDC046862]|uniref:hypothetical protein n=1 Tax=Streptomyces sp. NPDC046862 TaxID=3154603 RepID=UPI00345129E5